MANIIKKGEYALYDNPQFSRESAIISLEMQMQQNEQMAKEARDVGKVYELNKKALELIKQGKSLNKLGEMWHNE